MGWLVAWLIWTQRWKGSDTVVEAKDELRLRGRTTLFPARSPEFSNLHLPNQDHMIVSTTLVRWIHSIREIALIAVGRGALADEEYCDVLAWWTRVWSCRCSDRKICCCERLGGTWWNGLW